MKLFEIVVGVEVGAWRERFYGKAKTLEQAVVAASRTLKRFRDEVDDPKIISITEIGVLSF
jgi:hypothetical protein